MPKVTFADFGAKLASSRLRAVIPQQELAKLGIKQGHDVLVYGKHFINPHGSVFKKFVYDVCDDHFSDAHAEYYLKHTKAADLVTCNSDKMRDVIYGYTGRVALVIPDPYESEEQPAGTGKGLFWFGHQSNLPTINPYLDLGVELLTGEAWSRPRQLDGLRRCAAVLLPTDRRQAKSANRLIEAARNGRFCICGPLPAYDEFKEWMWVGDIREGVEWFNNNPEEAVKRVKACQDYIRDKYSPEAIGRLWLNALEKVWQ